MEFDYPVTGKYYDRIEKGCIISVTHDEQKDKQPSRIYRKIVVDAEIVWVAADPDGEEYVRPDGSKVQALEISLDEPRGEWAYRPHRWTCK